MCEFFLNGVIMVLQMQTHELISILQRTNRIRPLYPSVQS